MYNNNIELIKNEIQQMKLENLLSNLLKLIEILKKINYNIFSNCNIDFSKYHEVMYKNMKFNSDKEEINDYGQVVNRDIYGKIISSGSYQYKKTKNDIVYFINKKLKAIIKNSHPISIICNSTSFSLKFDIVYQCVVIVRDQDQDKTVSIYTDTNEGTIYSVDFKKITLQINGDNCDFIYDYTGHTSVLNTLHISGIIYSPVLDNNGILINFNINK